MRALLSCSPARRLGGAALLLLATALAACGGRDEGDAGTGAPGGKPVVMTVNYPLAYFAERLGGDAVTVSFPAPEDADPAWWKPDDATLEAYQKADLVLLNGATYAKWVAKASLPASKLVDTSAAGADRYIQIEHAVTWKQGSTVEGLAGKPVRLRFVLKSADLYSIRFR